MPETRRRVRGDRPGRRPQIREVCLIGDADRRYVHAALGPAPDPRIAPGRCRPDPRIAPTSS